MNRSELAEKLTRRIARDAVLRTVRDASREFGIPTQVVGGTVRDTFLGRKARDVDLIAGPGFLKLVHHLQGCWGQRGFRFRKRGVTTWRFLAAGHEVDIVDASRRGLNEDLLRREFTLNAIAFDIGRNLIVDPTGGLRDLRAGLLRMPRPGVIVEDPVRSVRAARFLAQFPLFRLHRAVRAEASSASHLLRRASVERVRDELDKLLLAVSPDRGLVALDDLDALDEVLPELTPMKECLAGQDRPSVWQHTLSCLEESARYRRRPASDRLRNNPEGMRIVRWALLLHDISKPETMNVDKTGRPTFHGHESLGARRADALMKRLVLPRTVRRRVRKLILYHLRPYQLADSGAPQRGMRRLVREAGDDLPLLIAHSVCDARGSCSPDAATRWRKLRTTCNKLISLYMEIGREVMPPLLDGNDVMRILEISPGPLVKLILEQITVMQEEGRIFTREDAVRYLSSNRSSLLRLLGSH